MHDSCICNMQEAWHESCISLCLNHVNESCKKCGPCHLANSHVSFIHEYILN